MNLGFLLQASPAGPGGARGLIALAPYLLMFVIFYFILIAPMRRQQKKTKQMLSNLKKGDRVITTSGIYGTVAQIEDQVVWLRIADTVKVKMNRSAIAGLAGDAEPSKDAA